MCNTYIHKAIVVSWITKILTNKGLTLVSQDKNWHTGRQEFTWYFHEKVLHNKNDKCSMHKIRFRNLCMNFR